MTKLNKRRKLFARMKKKTCTMSKNLESGESHQVSDADMEKVELPPTSFIAKYTIPVVEAPQTRSTYSSSSSDDEVDDFVWVSVNDESKKKADSSQKCFKSPENSGENFRSNPPSAPSSMLTNDRLCVPQNLTSECNCANEFEKSETTSTLLSGYQAEDEHNCKMADSKNSCDDAISEGSVDDSSIFELRGLNLPRSNLTEEELSTTSSECDSTSTKSTTYSTSSDSSSSTYFTTSESISSSSVTSAISTTDGMNEDADDTNEDADDTNEDVDDNSSTDSYYTSKSTSFA